MTSGVVCVGQDSHTFVCIGRQDEPTISDSQIDFAVHGLRRALPEFSAATAPPRWQTQAIVCVVCGVVLLSALVASGYDSVFAALTTIPFAAIVLLRCATLAHVAVRGPSDAATSAKLSDAELPSYCVLVPVFKEVAVAPGLVDAMGALDYPSDKLEVIFITEEHDPATRAALVAAGPAQHMRIVTVPAGLPQTKPRALNYALQGSQSELVAVYDAEDVPDPQQLRIAAQRLSRRDSDLACVQARLSIYNTEAGFLSRQFALEYAVLFQAILPSLERLGLPILLGGTSNHFRRSALRAVGGWDAFNVTEDADLGVRFARLGYRVGMIDSDTWEEAPDKPHTWLGQRTRWLKGWLQTYLVHMRSPGRLLRELGLWQFAGVQIMLAGMILSALAHPWFYFTALACAWTGQPILPGQGFLWTICWFNFVAGHAVGAMLGVICAHRSHGRVPLRSAFDLPLYWLAISVASYRALWDFYRRPHYWEKTPHAARPGNLGQIAARQ